MTKIVQAAWDSLGHTVIWDFIACQVGGAVVYQALLQFLQPIELGSIMTVNHLGNLPADPGRRQAPAAAEPGASESLHSEAPLPPAAAIGGSAGLRGPGRGRREGASNISIPGPHPTALSGLQVSHRPSF